MRSLLSCMECNKAAVELEIWSRSSVRRGEKHASTRQKTVFAGLTNSFGEVEKLSCSLTESFF